MRDHAAGAIVQARGLAAGHAQRVDEIHQRHVHVAHTADFGGPVVHLGVYVYGIVARPRRAQMRIPYALQVGGAGAGPGRAEHQVPPVVEYQFVQCAVVRAVQEAAQALVGGYVVHGAVQLKAHAVKQRHEVAQMALEQPSKLKPAMALRSRSTSAFSSRPSSSG